MLFCLCGTACDTPYKSRNCGGCGKLYLGRADYNSAITIIIANNGICGDYILTWRDYAERRTFEDEIGRNCYCIDIHGSSPEVEKIQAQCRYKKGESHGIPYRSLVPEKLDNLLVAGRCISVDRIVHGSTRIMPTCLVTGEAAGSAAALAVHSGQNAHNINVVELRKTLKQHGAFFN